MRQYYYFPSHHYYFSNWGMTILLATGILFSRFASSSAFGTTRAFHSSLNNRLINHRYLSQSSFLRMSSSDSDVKKRVLVPIADDSEEIETTCITDTLTRFGAEVVVASVKPNGELVCKMSRGVKVNI